MRVMLINPNILIHKGFPLKEAAVPLGLGYLASVITNKGHNVKIVDSILEGFNQCKAFNSDFNEYGLSDEQIVKKIKTPNWAKLMINSPEVFLKKRMVDSLPKYIKFKRMKLKI